MAKQKYENTGTAVADPAAPPPPPPLAEPAVSLSELIRQATPPHAPPPVTEQATLPPTQAGPSPRPGLWVYYWEAGDFGDGAKLRPWPAMLIQQTMAGWNLNVHKFKIMVGRSAAAFSPTPRVGCWSYAPSD